MRRLRFVDPEQAKAAYLRKVRGEPAGKRKRPAKARAMVPYSTRVESGLGVIQAPLRIVSAANLREHWRTKADRVARERTDVAKILPEHWREAIRFVLEERGLVVTLTRIAPRQLDGDNHEGGWKAGRDEIASWLGVDDSDPRVEWRYGQRRDERYGAEIEFRAAR